MNYSITSSPMLKPELDETYNEWYPRVSSRAIAISKYEKNSNFSLNQIMNNLFSEGIRQPWPAYDHKDRVYHSTYLYNWGYGHTNLFSEIQDLLCCLAPFTSVIHIRGLEHYVEYLKKQQALAQLPFDLWEEVIQEAIQRGLLSHDSEMPMFLRVQPIFPFFLKTRLYAFERKDKREAVEAAFLEYYNRLAISAAQMIKMHQGDKKALTELLIEPEYENLLTAIDYAMKAKTSIGNLYGLLTYYLSLHKKHGERQKLCQMVFAGLENYPQKMLTDEIGAEFVEILDNIARHHLLQGRLSEAEYIYRTVLALWLGNKYYPSKIIRRKSSAIYHQLGRVAQEQGNWEIARAYFMKDLQLSHEAKNRQNVTLVLRNLYRLWKETGYEDIPKAAADIIGVT